MQRLHTILCTSFLILSLLSACTSTESSSDVEKSYPQAPDDVRRDRGGKLNGEGGLFQLGGNSKKNNSSPSLGVNGYLWRATLDTIAFMPLTSADPFGGVILTDWYEDPMAPNERFKLNVLIMGGALRADGVKVSVFRQVLENKAWREAPIGERIGRELEDKILTRARQLRIEKKAG